MLPLCPSFTARRILCTAPSIPTERWKIDMKTQYDKICAAIIVCALALWAAARHADAQGTAFTYQGRLMDAVVPANGDYELTFALFDDLGAGNQAGGSLTNAPTS